MQHVKDKKSFSEIKSFCKNSDQLAHTFQKLLNEFNLNYIETLFSKVKKQGVAGKDIFRSLFVFRFLNFDNVHQLMQSGVSKELAFKKDVFYDFLNNPKINWRSILWLFSKQAIKIIKTKTIDDENTPKCIIVDDSILPKSGKAIELIGKVFNHGTHLYQLGIKLLTIGYNDGKSFIPLDFSLHHEAGKNNKRGLKTKDLKNQYYKSRDEDSSGYKRQQEVSQSKIEIALKCINRLLKSKLKIDYVLADSWFITEKFIRSIKSSKKSVDVIGLMKVNRIILVNGKNYKASSVPEIYRKDIKYCKKLKCYYIKKNISFKGIEMNAFWVRIQGQQNWKLLITTNERLSFIKTMEIYQIRWSIEVFFRDCKQCLGLNSCQSNDFDAHIATISLVFMNYTVLALKKRFEDYETLGQLFKMFKDFLLQQTLISRIWKLMVDLFKSILPSLGVDWEQFMSVLIDKQNEFINQFNDNFNSLFAFNIGPD